HQKFFSRQAAELGVPQPLVAHGANAAFYFFGICNSAKRCGDHVAVLEGTGEFVALVGIMPQPMEQLRESPFRRVHAATPIDGFEPFVVRGGSDLGRFALRAMIAPQVVLAKRLKIFIDRNYRRSGGIERNRFYLLP